MSNITFGYHGTSLSVAEKVVSGEMHLRRSNNPGDWLGFGIYFFEQAPGRALTWARRFSTSLNSPAVLRFEIDLSDCLDLIDSPYCIELRKQYRDFEIFESRLGLATDQAGLIVKDGKVYTTLSDDMNYKTRPVVDNFRDRSYINWFIAKARRSGINIRSVRGVYLSGHALFPTSHIFDWGHVQIAVLDDSAMRNPVIVS